MFNGYGALLLDSKALKQTSGNIPVFNISRLFLLLNMYSGSGKVVNLFI